jgi:hypothetical protein
MQKINLNIFPMADLLTEPPRISVEVVTFGIQMKGIYEPLQLHRNEGRQAGDGSIARAVGHGVLNGHDSRRMALQVFAGEDDLDRTQRQFVRYHRVGWSIAGVDHRLDQIARLHARVTWQQTCELVAEGGGGEDEGSEEGCAGLGAVYFQSDRRRRNVRFGKRA